MCRWRTILSLYLNCLVERHRSNLSYFVSTHRLQLRIDFLLFPLSNILSFLSFPLLQSALLCSPLDFFPFLCSPLLSQLRHCMVCGLTGNIWACLVCAHTGCGRYAVRHAEQHYKETQHSFSLELATGRYCYYLP